MNKPNSAFSLPSVADFRPSRGGFRRVLVAITFLVLIATPVRADAGLTGAVAANWFPRTVDAGLHSIAHQRAVEISACPTCMTHDLMRAGTSEVLAWNSGAGDPISGAISGWKASPLHNRILSDGSLSRIGCAQAVVAGVSYFACVLAPGGVSVAAAPPPAAPAPATGGSGGGGAVAGSAPTALLPDTSQRADAPVINRAMFA